MNSDPAAQANERTARRWQSEIVNLATERLGRSLTAAETIFITSRLGFIALEMIHDTVREAATADEIEQYLNSESRQ